MSAHTFTNKDISDRLHESLDRLHRETLRVEIWAEALSAFSKPIPEYDMPANFLLPPSARPH